jgi:hypothetical protein
MSVAFTREESAETAAEVELPDRPISPHANLVTAAGLEATSRRLQCCASDRGCNRTSPRGHAMAIGSNPLSSTRKSAQIDVISSATG